MTTYFVGVTTANLDMGDPSSAGTASTATDNIELRMGTAGANVTKRDVYRALKVFERWLRKGGLGAGANMPAS